MQLKIARTEDGEPEIFRSIQGEGVAAGRARTFIRLSGCNLHCVWCDTAYTWNWRDTPFTHERDTRAAPHKFDPAREMIKLAPEEAAALILEAPNEGLVITGGEPLMQMQGVIALIDALKPSAPHMLFEIETNGTIAPKPALAERVDLFMVSPKLAHSGNAAGLALKADALQAFAALDTAAFKFVARSEADIDTIALLANDLELGNERVWVMPEGTESAPLNERGRRLVGAIAAHGFNYADRLHIHLFGQKRGV
ncbi:MAG: 7-carboxy-7-deazaguanine synthase QueE [Hyphomonadaceae bacterium]